MDVMRRIHAGRFALALVLMSIATFVVATSGQSIYLVADGRFIEGVALLIGSFAVPALLIRYGLGPWGGAVAMLVLNGVNVFNALVRITTFFAFQSGMAYPLWRTPDRDLVTDMMRVSLQVQWVQPWPLYALIFLVLILCSRRYWMRDQDIH